MTFYDYNELDSFGEIYNLCFFETKIWRIKTALIVQQMIPPNYDKIP